MKIRLPLPILLATILAFSQTSQAWDALGHMIVAQIAYDQLSPEAKPKFDTAAAEFSKEKAGDRSVADAAYCPASSGCWMDDIRSLPDKYSQLSPWHYVELPFNEDGTPQPGMNRGDRLQSDRGHGLHIDWGLCPGKMSYQWNRNNDLLIWHKAVGLR